MTREKVDKSNDRFGTRVAGCARPHSAHGALACAKHYYASMGKQSLNRLIVDELTAATIGVRKQADFHDLVGRWEPDPDFDEIIAGQRQIDADKWK